MSPKVTKLLELFDAATAEVGGKERALFCLLKRFEGDLPEPDDYFMKAFRQVDPTDNPHTDMALWHLLSCSDLFWPCFEKVRYEKL